MVARRFLLQILMTWLLLLGALVDAPLASADEAASAGVSVVRSDDPSSDPWLNEQGPPVPERVEEPIEQVFEAWSRPEEGLRARGDVLRRVRLELGLGDLLAPAHALLGEATAEDPQLFSEVARDLAPGSPAIQLAHARALWSAEDVGGATKAFGAALTGGAANVATQLWLFENATVLLLIAVLFASLGFIALSALQVFPHAAHDLGDLLSSRTPGFARAAALAALLLVPLALGEGVVGFALALFALAFAYARGSHRNVLVMAAVLLVIATYPLAQLVSIATGLVGDDAIARSAIAVVRGVETRADLDRLEQAAAEDVTAAHALVLRARRYGLEDRARERLDSLLATRPDDGVVLANRGNIEMRRGQTEAAIEYYERAAAQIDSATLLFDLSQAYASAFRLEEYEATLVRAQRLDDDQVAALSGLDDSRVVADLEFPAGFLRGRMRQRALSEDPRPVVLVEALAPGRLGERWFVTAGAFALVALLCLLLADRHDHSSRCVRCGHRICTRCEETVWSEEICDDCHHLFQYPEATDPSLRMARLQALSEREARIDRFVLAGSVAIPGFAGLAAKRPDLAMFSLLLFGWLASWVAWPSGFFADPLRMGAVATLGFGLLGTLSLMAYGGLVFASLVVRKNR